MSKKIRRRPGCGIGGAPDRKVTWNNLLYAVDGETIGRARSPDRAGAVRKQKLGQYRIILSADTASEVRQMPSRSRRSGAKAVRRELCGVDLGH
ncbi:MAG: hypothetical protein MSB96_05435, partial [Subdoligranulum sp.]|nr:hypothetical protein [Subdoligranulum sp.]